MKKIKKLSPEVISKIAAGEVIERPAYVVKELIENALDAEATQIHIEVEKSGLDLITVIDNGEGMSREDIEECFKPHTTSKIQNENDLTCIQSFGFRGEALASIAAISRMSIKSRTKEAISGTEVQIENGKVNSIKPIGIAPGTSITVQQLFHSIPARQKFITSSATEFRLLLLIVIQYAMAFPTIRFFLSHNKKVVLNLPSNQSLTERIQEVLGKELVTQLIPIKAENEYLFVSGFISKPQAASSFTKQYLFVNNRSIKDKKISSTIKEAYGTLLVPETFPVCILFLKVPHEMIDVNIHPRKEEILFHNSSFIHETVRTTVEKALVENNLTFVDNRWKKNKYTTAIQKNSFVREGFTDTYAANVLKEEELPWQLQRAKIKKDTDVSQLHNLYIVAESEQGIFLIDQHAAHERILYEQFKQTLLDKKKQNTHRLSRSVEINLSVDESEFLQDKLKEFAKTGFTVEFVGKKALHVKEVPEILKDRNISEIIKDMINDLLGEKNISTVDSRSNRMLAYLACRAAVKRGDHLTKKKSLALIKKLEKTPNSYTCPHGRPTKIEMNIKDINSLFKR